MCVSSYCDTVECCCSDSRLATNCDALCRRCARTSYNVTAYGNCTNSIGPSRVQYSQGSDPIPTGPAYGNGVKIVCGSAKTYRGTAYTSRSSSEPKSRRPFLGETTNTKH
ncbi:hypothetical protein GCM10009103_54830 [Pseudomonas koreensis]|nr:hypothetical protein GCM10009103_54830 [Pseudomonas koreensis]